MGIMSIWNINIINCMFLRDPQTIQTHLNNDWTLLLKNIKILQDHHYDLLQYNHKIINTVRQQHTQLFVHDQICQHQQHSHQVTLLLQSIGKEEAEIHEKYEQMCVRQDGVTRLMGRVGARILQIYQISIDKCKQYDQTLQQKHLKMRRTLIELLNNKDGVKLDQIIKCTTAYTKQKLITEHQKLKKVILTLQNGQFTKIKEVYSQRQKKQVKSVERKLDILRDLSKAKAQKEIVKNDNKIKKQQQRIMNHLYSPMHLAKQQPLNDQQSNPQEKSQKLYNQILLRNKFNSQQITQFQQKSLTFPQKIRIFKEYIEKQDKKKTGEIFVRKIFKKQKQEIETRSQKVIAQNAHAKSLQTQIEPNVQNIMTQGNIEPQIKNQKKLINTQHFKVKSISKKQSKDLPNIFTSFVITHENFSAFKFDPAHRELFSRTNRHLLPDIASKGTSLDQNTQITKIKIDKILRTTAKKDFFQENNRKIENSRKTVMSNRQQTKLIEENDKAGLKFKGMNLTESLTKRIHLQRNRHEISHEDNSLHVRKAEIKYYQHKNTIL